MVVLVISAIVVHGQDKRPSSNNDKQNTKSEKNPSAPTVSVVNQPTTNHIEEEAKEHSESYLRRLGSPENLPNDLLFIVGVVGIIVAICTLLDVREQTRNTRKIAEAANKNSAAALMNAQAIVNSERPWVVGVEGRRSFRVFGDDTHHTPRFWLAIINSGRTPAKLVRVLMKFELRDSLDGLRGIEQDLDMLDICPLPYVLSVPKAEPFQLAVTMKGNRALTADELDQVKEGRSKFLTAYGVIEYEDILGTSTKDHMTGFFFYYAYGAHGPGKHGFQTYYSAHPDYLQAT